MGCVYLATSPSGKQYVGMTSRTLKQRKKEHFQDTASGSQIVFHKAIRKYGNALKWEILFKHSDVGVLLNREAKEIKARDLLLRGYNGRTGGPNSGPSPEVSKKIGKTLAYKWANDPVYRKRSLDAISKGMSLPENRRKGLAKAAKTHRTPEARARMSELKKRHYAENPETLELMSKARIAFMNSPEGVLMAKKSSEKIKAYWADPTWRAEWIKNVKKSYTPEYLEEMSSRGRRQYARDPNLRNRLSKNCELAAKVNSRAVSIDGTLYNSRKEARKTLGVSQVTIDRRLSSVKWPTWIRLTPKRKTKRKSISVIIDGVEYTSLNEAEAGAGFCTQTIKKRILDPAWSNWRKI